MAPCEELENQEQEKEEKQGEVKRRGTKRREERTSQSINQYTFCVFRSHLRSQETVPTKFLRMLRLNETSHSMLFNAVFNLLPSLHLRWMCTKMSETCNLVHAPVGIAHMQNTSCRKRLWSR